MSKESLFIMFKVYLHVDQSTIQKA